LGSRAGSRRGYAPSTDEVQAWRVGDNGKSNRIESHAVIADAADSV
jgi:hypothetical protein